MKNFKVAKEYSSILGKYVYRIYRRGFFFWWYERTAESLEEAVEKIKNIQEEENQQTVWYM